MTHIRIDASIHMALFVASVVGTVATSFLVLLGAMSLGSAMLAVGL
jgi:hypothetical protein